jgi:ABC-2 type transport system permease protein
MTERFWMFVTAVRTEQLGMRRNPLLLVNSGLLPVVLLIVVVEVRRPAPERAAELVAAVVLTALWGSTVWTSGGVLRRERTYGTLARCVCGLHSPFLILLGKSLGATLYSVGAILVSTTAAVAALRLPVDVAHPVWMLAALVSLLASATTLGALLACLFLVTRNGLIWSSALIYPVFLLGGLLIPADALPERLRWVPMLLSLRWIHEFLTGLAADRVSLGPLAVAAVLTAGYTVVAGVAYRLSVTRSRMRGSLDYA